MKKGFHANIEKLVLENTDFRRVIYTSQHTQLVLMALKPGEEIGWETHTGNDQFFRFEKGNGKVVINKTEYHVKNRDVIIVPAGSGHNIINTSENQYLKLYTLYSPPHHKDGIIRATKEEAILVESEFDGKTTE